MRRLAIVLIPLLIMALVLGAIGCGGEETKPTPTPTPTQVPTPTQTPTPTPIPTPTPTPVLTPTPTPTSGPSGPPPVCWFYGDVLVDGETAPDGIVVSAWIAGEKVAETTTSDGAYVLTVGAPDKDYTGANVSFMVDGSTTGVTSTWEAGEPINLALSIGQ